MLSKQAGIKYGDEWVDTLGMRGTQSGGITITDVEVPWADAYGFADRKFQPIGPYNTLMLPAIQVSANVQAALNWRSRSVRIARLHCLLRRHHAGRPRARPRVHQEEHARLALHAGARRARHRRVVHPGRLRDAAGTPVGI